MSGAPDTIDVPVWWSSGGMIFRRDALDAEHPENTYNYIARTYGVDPEMYGIAKPFHDAERSNAEALERAKAAGWVE